METHRLTSARCSFPALFASFLAVTFIFADLCYYGVISSPPCVSSNCSLTKPSVKLMMQDHMGHYVHHYSAEFFEQYTHISQLPFVTPNLITFIHLCLSGVAGYLCSNEKLFWRRFGVFLFQVRFFLDMLDGAVYRAQNNKHMMVNGWGTWGYVIDGCADVLGGIFLTIGLYTFLHRNPPRHGDVVLKSNEKFSRPAGEPFSMEMPVSRKMIDVTLGLILLQGLLRSFFWDRYQFQYYGILQAKLTKTSEVVMQARIFNSPLTRFILWCWKLSSADGMIAFLYLGIFLDCVWVVFCFLRRYGFIQLAVLVVLSQLLNWQMQELLPIRRTT